MIGEFDPSDTPEAAAVVVVGSGPAGLALATELERKGLRTLVLESGRDFGGAGWPLAINDVRMAPYDMGSSYLDLHVQRAFGGGANVWGGWCATLRDENFARPQLEGYGAWPLTRGILLPAYGRALDFLKVTGSRERILASPASLASGPAVAIHGFGLSPPLRPAHWHDRLASSTAIDIRTQATVEDILTEGDIVVGLRGRTRSGAPFIVRGERYVLAAGAVLNAILLQRNLPALRLDPARAAAVGRHLVDHPYIYGRGRAFLRPEVEAEIERSDGWFGGFLSLTPAPAELARLGARDFHVLVSRVDVGQWTPAEHSAAANHAAVFGRRPILYATIVGMEPLPPDGPNASSVAYAPRGNAIAGAVDLRFSPKQSEAGQSAVDWFRRHIAAMWRDTANAEDIVPVGHLIGTTRMDGPGAAGVVDRDCRVIGLRNLFVAGSSVFPTSGFVNPTLTIVALALRLADHLAEGRHAP